VVRVALRCPDSGLPQCDPAPIPVLGSLAGCAAECRPEARFTCTDAPRSHLGTVTVDRDVIVITSEMFTTAAFLPIK
jgi:hypothetical protein